MNSDKNALKDSKSLYYDCLIQIFQIYRKFKDVIINNESNSIRNKILMFELYSILRENKLTECNFLDFINNELSRIYKFCEIVLNEGQNGVDYILINGGWKNLYKFDRNYNTKKNKNEPSNNSSLRIETFSKIENINPNIDFYKKVIDMEYEIEEKKNEYNLELKKMKILFKEKIEKLQKEKEEEIEKEKEEIKVLNSKLIIIQKETKEKEKEYKEELQKIMNDFVNAQAEESKEKMRIKEEQIKNLQKKLEESNKKTSEELGEQTRKLELKLNEMQQKTKEEYQKKCEEIERKYKEKEEEDLKLKLEEEKRKLKEKQDKIKEINELYNNKAEKIKSEEIELILKEFNEKDSFLNLEEISKYEDNKKISNLFNNLLENKNASQVILNKLNIYIEESKNKIEDIKHLNILLVGPSGVGKSTLINAILELKNKVKTGIGLPQTTEIEYFSSEKSDFLRLYDSRGIEKNENEGALAICNKLKDFILKQLESKNPNNYIHCIWYCWYGTRLENIEVEIIKKLSEQYTFETLPIIIVYTNAIDKEQIELAEKVIKETYQLKNDFIPILAAEKPVKLENGKNKIMKPYNLDKLREKSFQLAMSAVNSSCYEGLIKDIKNHFNDEIHNFTETIQNIILKKANDFMSNLNEGTKIDIIYKECMNIILTLLMVYLFLDQELNVEITEYEINKNYENEIEDKNEKENKENDENENNKNIIKENIQIENNNICENSIKELDGNENEGNNKNEIKENIQNENEKNENIEKHQKEEKENDDNNQGSEIENKDNDLNEKIEQLKKENNEIEEKYENKTNDKNIENVKNNNENEIKEKYEKDNKNNMIELFDNKTNDKYINKEKENILNENSQIKNNESLDNNALEGKGEIENENNIKKEEEKKNEIDLKDEKDYSKNSENESKDNGEKIKDIKKESLQNSKTDNNEKEIYQEFENEINQNIKITNNKEEKNEQYNKIKEKSKKEQFHIKIEKNNFEFKGNTYIIKDFIEAFFKKNKEIYDKKIDEIISRYLNDLYDKILNLKFDFSNQYYDLFSPCLDTKEELKKNMNDSFSKKIELTLIKNSFIFLIHLLIYNIKQYFTDLYFQEISKQEVKSHVLEVIKISLDKIDEEIKNYNKLMEENKKNNEEISNSIDKEQLIIQDDVDSLINDSEDEKE